MVYSACHLLPCFLLGSFFNPKIWVVLSCEAPMKFYQTVTRRWWILLVG
jgi:hypothetical protein